MTFRSSRSLVVLGLATAFGAGFLVRAHGQSDGLLDLVTYRTALEQLRAGRANNAQILLESTGRGAPLAPENALLLAYLQDANGQSEAARATLSKLETPSPLAGAYLRRLGGATEASVAAKGMGATARLAATDARVSKLEASMLQTVNDERERQGLGRLENDARLAEVARAHSAEMRDKKYFAHESPTPELHEPLDRYVAGMGVTPHIVAENIYRVYGGRSFLTEKDVLEAHNALMHSPGHRANLLNRDVTRIGIGFSTDSTGDLWITQMFAKPF